MDALPTFDLLRPTHARRGDRARARRIPAASCSAAAPISIVNIRRGIVAPPVLIDMNGVAELRAIKADAQCARDRRRR